MYTQPFWSEWDGRGYEDAVAVRCGWHEDYDEAIRDIRRLGIAAREFDLMHGWLGFVGSDVIPDACAESGECINEADTYVDPDTITKATFAFIVVQ